MSLPSQPSPLQQLWLRNFPFTYWDNRLEKISRYNSEDRLEVLFVMLQLVDLYAHLFSARARNPEEPWFMVKERTYTRNIENTLAKLTVEEENSDDGHDTIFVERLADEPEGLIGFKQDRDDWEVTHRDWIAADFLGCPVRFDEETKEMEFLENPDLHFIGANAILNFWQENRLLYNDFKHGFRVLPCDASTLEFLAETEYVAQTDEFRDLVSRLSEEETDDEWKLFFMRLSTAEQETHYDTSLEIYEANIESCLSFAQLTIYQLHNLFGTGGKMFIANYLNPLIEAADEGVIPLITRFGKMDFVMYKPGHVPNQDN